MKTLIALIHLILIIGYWISPFIFDWRIVILFSLFIYIPTAFALGYCPLTKYQFRNTKYGFQQYYLAKIGIKLNNAQNKLFTRVITPLVVSAIAVVYQLGLK